MIREQVVSNILSAISNIESTNERLINSGFTGESYYHREMSNLAADIEMNCTVEEIAEINRRAATKFGAQQC